MPAARPSPQAGRCAGLAPVTARARLRRRCSGAARPPQCGGCGAVRPSGPVGGAAAPAQAAPRLRRWLRFGRAACALAARRSGPPPLAAYGSQAGAAAAACGLAPAGGRNLYAARKGRNALRAFAPYRAWRAAGARGNAACGRGCRPVPRPARPRQAPRRAASRPQRGPCLPVPRPAWANRGGCPALWRVPAPLSLLTARWCLLCRLLLLVVCLALVVSGGWSAGLVVSLAGLLLGLPGLSGRPLWQRRLPVSWQRRLPQAHSGLPVPRSAVSLLSGAGSGKKKALPGNQPKPGRAFSCG